MKPEEVIYKFEQYQRAARANAGSSLQLAIDTLTIAILDGNTERFEQYRRVARANAGNYEQLAIDTLTMTLMDHTSNISGLLNCLLNPHK